ncbi:glycosyltransferase [Bradyrhizobium sp. CNPSo 4010]|uniref:Glycosyltransferase n=1 Tax=Bradyrhizobium agreste TaxID=2751811 RepID=A0ABS0PSW2_9BRAD|nr:glycosyltransferase [Bradyrhizobium agreste]MBH5399934.1 glycosyltransferase [Bradyrhizobium agreste]
MQKILFVHNNFPAQFLPLCKALSGRDDIQMAAIGSPTARALPGVSLKKYMIPDGELAAAHPFARRFEAECRRAEQVLYSASNLKQQGFVPDLVVAHPGWGEMLPLRPLFPEARIIAYCEFYYRAAGQDVGFDAEFPDMGVDGHVRIHLKNAATLLALDDADAGLSPTLWQRSTYPGVFQSKIEVIHDGVDTDLIQPDETAALTLPSGKVLTRADEVVTFATRSHEPLRGFHCFLRALPAIMAARPNAQILIIGGTAIPYGLSPPEGHSWRTYFFREIEGQVDASRIHFAEELDRAQFLHALQISSAHVYFTYPFVLSWSLLEAMSAGCLIIGSDTAPLREVIDGSNGILVPFFDIEQLSARVIETLASPRRFSGMRRAARETVMERYDLNRICLPRLLDFYKIATPSNIVRAKRTTEVLADRFRDVFASAGGKRP